MAHQATMDEFPADAEKPGWSFYLSWILFTTLCIPLAFLFSIPVLIIITEAVGDIIYVNGIRHITEDYLAIYFIVPFAGFLTGALQYVLLRRYLPRMGWWVVATAAGWLLGVILIALPVWLGWIDAPVSNQELIFLVMGMAIGGTQWLLLRHRLPQAGWWIPVNALSWLLLGVLTPGNSLNQYGLFTLGFLPACATAALLALQWRRVPPAELRL